MRSTRALRFLALLAVTCIGPFLAGCSTDKSSVASDGSGDEAVDFAGYVRLPASDVSAVVLPDANGGEVAMTAAEDGLRLVFFGYTTCPDVCPATLGYVKMALGSLTDSDRGRVEVDMITVDPSRDDPTTLTNYVRQFIPDANALRTDDEELLRSAADAFGADYSVTIDGEGQPEVSHTGDLYAVDGDGVVVLAWPFGSSPADIETDLRRLLDGERPDPLTTNDKEIGS